MREKNKKMVAVIILITELLIIFGSFKYGSNHVEKGVNYSISYEGDNSYTYRIYDKNGWIMGNEPGHRLEDWIGWYSDDILRMKAGGGQLVGYTYYNLETREVSPQHAMVIGTHGNYIACMDFDGMIIIRDIFDENRYYIEIKRDFCWSASDAINKFRFIDNHTVYVNYNTDQEFIEKEEMITIPTMEDF